MRSLTCVLSFELTHGEVTAEVNQDLTLSLIGYRGVEERSADKQRQTVGLYGDRIATCNKYACWRYRMKSLTDAGRSSESLIPAILMDSW